MGVKMNLNKKKIIDKLIEMLVEIDWANKELQNKVLYGKNGLKKLFENYISPNSTLPNNILDLYEIIAEAMNDYLKKYPAPAYYKENLRSRFWDWFDYSADIYGLEIEDYKPIFDEAVEHYALDTDVQIIKMLHNQEGVTKQEIADELKVSERTVQAVINRLVDKDTDNPIRLGGYPMHIELKKDEDYNFKSRKLYCTEETMHPITFQFNMMQVGTMLEALSKLYAEDESYTALYIGVNLWCQLSRYAKERVVEIFGRKNEDLMMLIDDIRDLSDNHIRRFETEREAMENGDYKDKEKLLSAYKGGWLCTIELKNPKRILHNQRIFYDYNSKQYYAVSSENVENKTDKTYLEENCLHDLYEE